MASIRFFIAVACGLLVLTHPLSAHAVVIKSSPTPGSAVAGPNVPIVVAFNSKIDFARSKLVVVGPAETHETIAIQNGESGNTLRGEAHHLKPGLYQLQWQVLAIDGHITRGQIPFTVK